MTYRVVLAAVAIAVLLAGCGSRNPSMPVGGDGAPASSPEGLAVDCGGSVYHPHALADAPSVSSLPAGPAGAVDDLGEPAFDPSKDWKVVHQSADRVDLVRELDQPVERFPGDVRTHESRTVELITDAPNVPDGTWLLTSSGACAQRLVTDDDLGDADLALAEAPAPQATSLDLLVVERACASGQSAEGRVELVELAETADQVRLRIGVRPRDVDSATCPGNPATPFTVELGQPLGDREIVNASVVPPRPLTVAGDRGDEPDTTPPASTAVELCRGAGRQEAEIIANVQAIDAVYRTRAGDMAAWDEQGGAPDDRSRWRDHPDDQLVAVCVFDAVDIHAPAGPALQEGQQRPAYDKLTVGVAEDGTAYWLQALRTDWPAGKTYAPEDHAPPGSERVW